MRRVNLWIVVVLAIFALLVAYNVLAARMTPYSSAAYVQAYVVNIAPQVSGNVLEVFVEDNQDVDEGSVLFRIDPERYQIAVDSAEAALAQAGQAIGASTAYEILSLAPSPWMLAAATLLGGLVFGRLIAAGGPRAPLFVPAFVAMIILLGSSLSPITDDASQLFTDRFPAVLVTAAIACAGLALLDAATRRRQAAGAPEPA